MIATPLPLCITAAPTADHYCPVCLRLSQPQRRQHREACQSGSLEVSLLCCPTCGLTLAAQSAEWVQAEA